MFITSPVASASPPTTASPVDDADPQVELDAEPRPQRVAQADERLAQPERAAHRALRVVLVLRRHAEDRDHRVAGELLDRAAELLDDRAHPIEVRGLDALERLDVQPLAERRRADEVAEEDGDELALGCHAHGRKRTTPAGRCHSARG